MTEPPPKIPDYQPDYRGDYSTARNRAPVVISFSETPLEDEPNDYTGAVRPLPVVSPVVNANPQKSAGSNPLTTRLLSKSQKKNSREKSLGEGIARAGVVGSPASLHVSSHAISRYRERVAPVTADEAEQALRSPTILKAAEIGAPYVRLPGRQRVVLEGQTVVTVLPAEIYPGRLERAGDWRARRG